MIKLLAKIFIKNHNDYQNEKVRSQYGILCGAFGIFLNAVLFTLKFVFGTLAASVAMVADAFNNLSDAASSVVQILGFKLSTKKPDPDHPFGHGRIEYKGIVVNFSYVARNNNRCQITFTKSISADRNKAFRQVYCFQR